jgi:hypothetical protein
MFIRAIGSSKDVTFVDIVRGRIKNKALMRTRLNYAVIAMLFILAVCLTGLFVDPDFLTALFLFWWISLPAGVVATFLLLAAIRTGRSRAPAFTVLALLGGACLLFFLVAPVSNFAANRAESDARDFPPRVAPLLESYRQTNGSYPATLERLPSRPSMPRLLRHSTNPLAGYYSDGTRYSFRLVESHHIWLYESDTQAWRQVQMEHR